jgi:hypothetical protein
MTLTEGAQEGVGEPFHFSLFTSYFINPTPYFIALETVTGNFPLNPPPNNNSAVTS